MSPFENLIDPADFGTIRRYLGNSRSSITDVLLVATQPLLVQVAELLTGERPLSERQRELQHLVVSGQVRVGVASETASGPATFDLESLANDTPCRVLFVPPFYLVWAESGAVSTVDRVGVEGVRYDRLANDD